MNPQTKVTFNLNIGLYGCDQKETFTLDELGYDPEIDTNTDIDKLLEEKWQEWSNEYIDGGWEIREAEKK
ncbi:hypothetical protein OYT88_06205 [Sporolactobacillus sp. CQH2019]|uniref:DUF7167 family protein n=1 Tax=Sporolactobacillus sp. CQH2019 TaxID=3023512 RepID=UPI002367DBA2|nr:hypothetical protein [Sporolactobacillus sp. CQH2019]MDD9148139.1 hypothetical protein [Sporolactobacillus sp. CQH2019]